MDRVSAIPIFKRGKLIRWALVDEADARDLRREKWSLNGSGYAGNSRGLMHRLISGCEPKDGKVVDHINGDRLDNRRSNLRVCDHRANARNAGAWREVRRRVGHTPWREIKHGVGQPLSLRDIRILEDKSQGELAAALGVEQPRISQMENSADALVSSIRRYIEGLGGELIVEAVIPNGDRYKLNVGTERPT